MMQALGSKAKTQGRRIHEQQVIALDVLDAMIH